MNRVLIYAKTNGRCWYCGKQLKIGVSKIGLEKIKNFDVSDSSFTSDRVLIKPDDIKDEFILSQIKDAYENAFTKKLIYETPYDKIPKYVTRYFHVSDGFSVDHIKSSVVSGRNRNRINNVVPCCTGCNSSKGTRDMEHFRHILWEKEFEKTFGVTFSRKQKDFLEQMGVELPLKNYVFYFERNNLSGGSQSPYER